MPNHPNRGRRVHTAASPKPENIRAAREAAGLTQAQAAKLIHASLNGWFQWETGQRRMHPAFWELFLIKCGNSPWATGV